MTAEARITGLDGKSYPRKPLSATQRSLLVTVVHELAHDGRSVREIVAALAERGITRSVGSIHTDLTKWRCTGCSGE